MSLPVVLTKTKLIVLTITTKISYFYLKTKENSYVSYVWSKQKRKVHAVGV